LPAFKRGAIKIMDGKPLADDLGPLARVNHLLVSLIYILIIGAAVMVVMLGGCLTALGKITPTKGSNCAKKRTYSLAYGESLLFRNSIASKAGATEV
jgi:hypothetical protein